MKESRSKYFLFFVFHTVINRKNGAPSVKPQSSYYAQYTAYSDAALFVGIGKGTKDKKMHFFVGTGRLKQKIADKAHYSHNKKHNNNCK